MMTARIVLRRHRKYIIISICCLLIILWMSISYLISIYGSLFYWETFLPQPPLPPQYRQTSKSTDDSELNYNYPTIACLIITAPQYHANRALHVQNTWGKHCDHIFFLTSEQDSTLKNTVVVDGAGKYSQLWSKVTYGFNYLQFEDIDYDWVIKTDDDTFLIVENLKFFLKEWDHNKPLTCGLELTTWDTNSVYMNGGAGYVLSRSAVNVLVKEGLQNHKCTTRITLTEAEDVNMANCLRTLGVMTIDTRDKQGLQRFHMYPPQSVIDPRQAYAWKHLWLMKKSLYPYKFGYSNLSNKAISFHYVDAETMYLLYYLVYIININNNDSKINKPITNLKNKVLTK